RQTREKESSESRQLIELQLHVIHPPHGISEGFWRHTWEAQRPRSKKSCLRLTDNYQMTPTSELIDDLLSERESRMKGEHRG
ncbi:MAG: hypothetical protein WA763_00515, partial [Pseudolabrys sp.]